MGKIIDKSILRYIHKDLQKHVIWATKWKDTYATYTCYEVAFDKSFNDKWGNETTFIAHGIKELKWCCKVIKEGWRGEIL